MLLAGEEAGDLFRDGKAYDVQVWSTPETRANLDNVRALQLDTPTGERIRLSDVADVRLRPIPNIIQHEGGSRRLDVGAEVSGRDLGSTAREIEAKLAKMEFSTGYHV